MSNQKLNQYIKEVAVKVGMHQKNHLKQNNPSLFEKQTFKITKGGKTTQTTHEKWEKIQSHTARRSFATNAYLANINSKAIMKITGHKTESSLLKYIKVTELQNAQIMLENEWFNKY